MQQKQRTVHSDVQWYVNSHLYCLCWVTEQLENIQPFCLGLPCKWSIGKLCEAELTHTHTGTHIYVHVFQVDKTF